MATNTPDYHTLTAQKRMQRIRELLKELPPDCTGFIRSIAQTTGVLTRLSYAYDLRLFFRFLCQERAAFSDVSSQTRFTTDVLCRINARDIRAYEDFLSQYIKTQTDENDRIVAEQIVQNHELGIMRKLSSVRSFFGYLFTSELIPANVAALVTLPKTHEKVILYMEESEIERMFAAAYEGEGLTKTQQRYQKLTSVRDMAILLLFLGTGIRVSECVGIDIDDVDFERNAFLVTRKGGDQVMLYFNEQVSQALQAYMLQRERIVPMEGHENALFLSMQKRRITQRAVENLVKKYALTAAPLKKRLSPHKLRSTFGTRLYQETGDIYLVADVLGHADVNTTRKHYAAMSDQRRREAAKHVFLPTGENGEKTDDD